MDTSIGNFGNVILLILTLISLLSVGVGIVLTSLVAIAYGSTNQAKDKVVFGKVLGASFLSLCLCLLCVILHFKGYRLFGSELSLLLINSLIFFSPMVGLLVWSKLRELGQSQGFTA